MQTIRMPQALKGMQEGTVSQWLKGDGQRVGKGEPILEIATADAIVQIEAPADTTLLKRLVPEGTPLAVGEPVGLLGEPGEDIEPALEALGREGARADGRLEEAKPGASEASASPPPPATPELQQAGAHSSAEAADVVPVLMPQVGNTMEEGTIVSWKVSEGDQIEAGQIVFEVETDKATVEIEAADAGRLARIVVQEGETVPVKTHVAYLAGSDAAIDAYLAAQGISQATPRPQEAAKATAPTSEMAAPAAHDVVPVLMPQVGNTMEEGTIVSWKVAEGDQIEAGQVIFEVETDKATVEIEASDTGRLARVVVQEGETVPVKTPVAYLADGDAAVDAHLAAQGEPRAGGRPPEPRGAPAPPQAPTVAGPAATTGRRVKASPAARKLARGRGIDLAHIGAGSGPRGRILSADVPQTSPRRRKPADPAGQPVRHKMTSMRAAIAKGLLWSKQNIPHFYMKLTIDADPLYAAYQRVKAVGEFKCTINDFVVLAAAQAMGEFPAFRCKLEGDELIEHPDANIGIAVGTEDGLLVPVLVGAGDMTLRQIAAESRRLVENARNGRLEGVGRGLLTVSNLGMFGIEEFAAIINPPEAAILAVGAIREDVVVVNGAMRPGRTMTVIVSADHRIIDGLVAAQFCGRLKELLERPDDLVCEKRPAPAQ